MGQAEISLCRVYKRGGVEDHPSLPRYIPTRTTSSARKHQQVSSSTPSDSSATSSLALSHQHYTLGPISDDHRPDFTPHAIDDLQKIVNNSVNHHQNNDVPGLLSHFVSMQPAGPGINALPYTDRLWDWNSISEASKDSYNHLFK